MPREDGAGPLREIDLTPLIDVSLVLVVMLLLATPLAFESAFGLRDAPAAAKAAPEEQAIERVEIAILSEAEVRVNRDRVPVESLAAVLRPLLATEAPPAVVVTCGDAVPHGAFVRVLDTAKLCGAGAIAVTEGEAR